MLEIFIMTDQPVTCPHCLARAEILIEFLLDDTNTQLCKCLNDDCSYLFLKQESKQQTGKLQ
jgi:predicted RNA-binding Zn ribbon-like protein